MKPRLLSTTRSAFAPSRNFPATDSHYQLPRLPKMGGACACPRLPSFRNISREYFRDEARAEFWLEVIAFAAMVVAAAIPMVSNAHALFDMLRSISPV